jgi:hypothetical protein
MGCRGIVSEGNHVLKWHSLVQIAIVGVNPRGGWNFCDVLDFEGVHGNTALGNDESKEAPGSDAEHALEGVQADVVLTTPLEDDP